jgi:hypothetical protein
MAGVVDMVLGQLGSGGLGAIAGQLGTSDSGAKSAVTTAVGVLTGAMALNTAKPGGAEALDAALAKDHDGSIFDNLGGFLSSVTSGPGASILGHVLGGSQPQVEQTIAAKSGLSLDKVAPLLMTVAPLVMGVLGKMKKDNNMDAAAVAGTLATETQAAQSKDEGNVLSTVLGMLGGGGQSAAPTTPSSSSGGLGGILGALGGLFKKKGS